MIPWKPVVSSLKEGQVLVKVCMYIRGINQTLGI